MVLAFADYDLVTFMHESLAETERHKIYGSRRSGGEHYLLRAHIQAGRHRSSRVLILFRSYGRNMMHRPVDIGTVFLRKFDPFPDHAARSQRSRSIVEVDERLSIYLFVELGEFIP